MESSEAFQDLYCFVRIPSLSVVTYLRDPLQSRSISLTANYKQFDKKIHHRGKKTLPRETAFTSIVYNYFLIYEYTSGEDASLQLKGKMQSGFGLCRFFKVNIV